MEQLSERAERVLESIIHAHILTAEPVGSRTISRKFGLGVSPATIRNTMVDLEEMGYVDQPHTSAGRVPTDKGYRYYVDMLMPNEGLTKAEKEIISRKLRAAIKESSTDRIFEEISKVLAAMSKQLGIVLSPFFDNGILVRLDLVPLSEHKLLFVLTIKSGIAKTLLIDFDKRIDLAEIDDTLRILNERLTGLTIREIRETIGLRLKDVNRGDPAVLGKLVSDRDRLFRFVSPDELYFVGTTNIFSQPEFRDWDRVTRFMEVLEKREPIVYFLSQRANQSGVVITIGRENRLDEIQYCSLVTSSYRIGNVCGMIGVIGPTRMRYPKLASLVGYVAELTGKLLSS